MNVFAALVVATSLIAVAVLVGRAARKYWKLRGPHVVRCPETGCTAAITVDPLGASGLRGHTRVEVASCSRWPEREGCDQACLRGFVEGLGPGERASLTQWYKGKHCALCGKRFARVSHVWDLPAPLDTSGISHQWADVQDVAEMLPECRPVCWECQLAESMQRVRSQRNHVVPRDENPPSGA
jgi:hypothetical protein